MSSNLLKSACLVLLMALAFLPSEVAAQSNTLEPSVTFDLRYDSNARFRSTGSTSDNGDFIASVAPRFAFTRKRELYNAQAFYHLTADYHTNDPDLNALTHSAGINLDGDLSKLWHIGLGDRVDYAQDSLRAIGQGILVTRTNIFANTAYIGVSRTVTKNTSVALDLRDSIQDYADPALVDSRTDTAALTGRYRYSQTGTARLRYALSVYHFDTDGGNDITTNGLSIGMEEALTPTLTVDAGAGAEYASNLDSSGGQTFLIANASLKKTMKDSAMSLSYQRDLTTPTGLTNEISVRDAVTFVWDFALRRNLNAAFYAGLAKNKTEPEGRVDVNSYIVELSGNYRVNNWVLFGAGLSHYQQWTKDDFGEGLARNRVFVNVTLTGQAWRF